MAKRFHNAKHKGSRPQVTTRLMPVFQGIAAGSTAYLELLMGVRYRALYLVYGGTTFDPSKIDAVRILANQQVIHNLTGSKRDTLNQFDQIEQASTHKVLTIPFFRPHMRQYPQEWFTWLNTGVACPQAPQGITSLRVEVDIDASAVAPTLSCYAEICDNDANQGDALLRAETYFENVPAAGDYLHQHKYNKDPLRHLLTRMAFWDNETNITSFYMLENQAKLIERTSALNHAIINSNTGKNAMTSQVIFDTAESGNDKCAIKIRQIDDLEIHTVHTAGNAQLAVTTETLGRLGG